MHFRVVQSQNKFQSFYRPQVKDHFMNSPDSRPQYVQGSANKLQQDFGILFWIVAVIATIMTIFLGLIGSFVVPEFGKVYVTFGADIPAPTKLLTESRVLLWLAFFVAVAMWGYCWKSPFRYKHRINITIGFFSIGVISVFTLAFTTWALYLPIYGMGSAV